MRSWAFTPVIVGIVLALSTGTAHAFSILEPNTAGNVRVEAGTTISDTVLAGGSDVSIRGAITDDAFLAGSEVTMSSTVDGNAVVAGQSVHLTGTVRGDVFVAAGTVVIERDAVIEGDVLGFAGTIDLVGTIRGKLHVYASTVQIDGTISGDTAVQAEQLILGEQAKLGGDVSGTVTRPLNRAPGAEVAGTLDLGSGQNASPTSPKALGDAATFLSQLYGYIVLLIAGFALMLIAPRAVSALRDQVYQLPGRQFTIGLLALLIAPALFVLTLIFIVTLPIGLFELALFGAAALIGNIVASLWVGDLLGKHQWSPFLALATGGAILRILGFVPVVGGLLVFGAWITGLGAVLSALWQLYTKHAK